MDRQQDQQAGTLNIDAAFGMEIPILNEYMRTEPNANIHIRLYCAIRMAPK